MYCCKLGTSALILALSASHHFILLHSQQPPSSQPDPSPLAVNRNGSVEANWLFWSPPPPPPDFSFAQSPTVNNFSTHRPDEWAVLTNTSGTKWPIPTNFSFPQTPPYKTVPAGLISGAVIGWVVLGCLLRICCVIWRKRRSAQSAQPQPPKELSIEIANSTGSPLPVNNPEPRRGGQQTGVFIKPKSPLCRSESV